MFKDELRRLRIDNNYTQDDLAKELDVSKSTISMYESGSRMPGLEMLEAIADFFNVDMNKLTGGSQKSSPALGRENSFTNSGLNDDEINIISKYRLLDNRGKQSVTDTLEREYLYISTLPGKEPTLAEKLTILDRYKSNAQIVRKIAALGGNSETTFVPKEDHEKALAAFNDYKLKKDK